MSKKKVLICVLFFWTQFTIAQTNTFPPDGYVGIGTTSPSSKLEVMGDLSISGLKIKKLNWGPMPNDTDQFLFQTHQLWNGATACIQLLFYEGHKKQFRNVLVMINNIGGTNNIKIDCMAGSGSNLGLQLKYANRTDNPGITEFYISKVGNLMWGQYAKIQGYGINFNSPAGLPTNPIVADLKQEIEVQANGYVGIGTSSPKSKLDVAGTITATEIKVEAQTADFVFEEDYQLKSLEEVEQFVQENKHLPDVPSAKQMEESGVGLAEMNKLLLQKVEELTIYMIEQNKINKLQAEEIKALKEDNEMLKKQLKVAKE